MLAIVSGVLKDSFRTKLATNGEKALAIANGPEKPDLILLDVTMPGRRGRYEVCRGLKDNPETRGIPIIRLTAKTEEVDEEKGFDVWGGARSSTALDLLGGARRASAFLKRPGKTETRHQIALLPGAT